MKVYLKGSKRVSGGRKPYKAGWYPCTVLDIESSYITAKLVDGNVIRKTVSRFRPNK